jgi:hypothetical protein
MNIAALRAESDPETIKPWSLAKPLVSLDAVHFDRVQLIRLHSELVLTLQTRFGRTYWLGVLVDMQPAS